MLTMLSKEDLLLFERKFSKFNLLTTGFLLFYYLLFLMFGNLDMIKEKYIISCFVIVLLMNSSLIYFNHVNNDNIMKFLKFLMLILLGFATFYTTVLCSAIIMVIFYFAICIQCLFLFDITESYSRMAALVFTVSPITLVCLIYLIFYGQNDFMVFISIITLFTVITILYNITCRFSEFAELLYNKIYSLNGIAATNKEENDNIKIQKNKLEQINEQLSIERFKLKQANEIISKNSEEIKIQNTIVNAAAKALDIKKLLECLTDATMVSLKLDFVSFLIRSNDDEIRFLHSSKYTRESSMGRGNKHLIENRQFANTYIDNGVIVDIGSNANQQVDALTGTKINSIIITPIVINDNSMGLYILGSTRERAFADNEAFLNSLFSHITLAINNALLYSRMHTMATKDGLTGIYNRRYFNSIYSSIIKRCMKHNHPLTVILFDIDRFKKINDTYGHIFGDEVIRFCGHTALQYAKKYDGLPVRFGGEEFVIVFPKKGTIEVEAIMKEMHLEIKKYKFDVEEKKIAINTSVGIASYPENCKDAKDLLNSADGAMYYSKKNGRGRITIYNEDIIA